MISNVKHIGIVGGGVAGLSFASSVVKRLRDMQHHSGEKNINMPTITIIGVEKNNGRGLGLWPNSIKALRKLGLENFINESALKIPSAAYRTTSGNWLSKCSPTNENHERVYTVLENDLIRELKENVKNVKQINFVEGTVVDVKKKMKTSIGRNEFNFELKYHHGDDNTIIKAIECDFLIGADGMNSITRQSTVFSNKAKHAEVETVAASSELKSQDVVIMEGILQPNSSTNEILADITEECQYPFETLGSFNGSSVRFACIPLKSNSLFYFATIPSNIWSHNHGYSGIANSDDLLQLQNIFEHFHYPIPLIIAVTIKHGLNVNKGTLKRYDSISSIDINTAVKEAYLLGDSWHVTHHNLAQGASVAIEDAWELAYALSNEDTLEGAQDTFHNLRKTRLRNYKRFTFFTDTLARFDNYGLIGSTIRNSMQYVPPSINGKIFDYALDASLGGKHFALKE
eukprot:g1456.t1